MSSPNVLPQYYIGQIEILDGDTQVLKRSEWTAIASTDSDLCDPPPRMGMNPATGKPMRLRLPPDERGVRVGDEYVGGFRWSGYDWKEGLGTVLVFAADGYEDEMRSIADRLADALKADFGVDDSLMHLGGKPEQQ
ncbi:hypothetical protein [Roseiconus lacunae]|uniref:hypothetical protein n=1 Tax=Roseiconus lacunae TaxID=2605694 RepID=UPI001E59CA42|nr:hypothetical protein [Roseiconus lacunae]MCD0462024.1 hypothetical protein [Roseiconus lacunae]